MTENESLEVKYGRRKHSSQEQNTNIKQNIKEDISSNDKGSYTNSERNNTFTKKTKEDLTQKQKEIKSNIENILSQYSYNETKNYGNQATKSNQKKDSTLISFIKGVLIICILLVFVCIGISVFAKPDIAAEGDQIIRQIENAEKIYFSSVHQYHFFPKTNFDKTLGVDISSCKYFSSYEVRPNENNTTYAIKIYGATDTFTMSYYYLKALLKDHGILE